MLPPLKTVILDQPYLASVWVACLVLLVFIYLQCFNPFASRGPKPPRVAYSLPWIGSAIEMGKDPDAFFKRASSKLGPIFRVKTVGKDITYVTSAELISSVYRDTKTFEFTPIRLEITKKIFGLSTEATYSSHMTEVFLPVHHRALSPQNIVSLLERHAEHARECVLNAINKLDGQSSPLIPFVVPPAYYAASYAFFGRAFDAEKSYKPFRRFDDQFYLMAAGVPRYMLPGPYRAWNKISELFEQYLEAPHEDCSDLVSRIEMDARDAGWALQDIARSLGSDLWALQSNAIYAAYWVLALALQKPHGISALVAEVDSARSEWKASHPNQSGDAHPCQWLLHAPLPLLTSSIQEVLRLSTSTFSIRRVHHPVDFAGFHFETGERVICVTRAVHLDDEIHPNAAEFDPGRYLEKQSTFSKNGKVVPNHSMPFGGGTSMCEGRHFVMGELKNYLGLILSHATIELDHNSTRTPPKLFKERMGVGLMPPVGDLRVKIRRRTDA